MLQITILLPGPVAWALLFKTEAVATEAFAKLVGPQLSPNGGIIEDPTVLIDDEYGHCFLGKLEDVKGVLFEDMTKSKQATIERNLHNLHVQADYTRVVQADPKLKVAAMQQGPAVHSPFMNGGRN